MIYIFSSYFDMSSVRLIRFNTNNFVGAPKRPREVIYLADELLVDETEPNVVDVLQKGRGKPASAELLFNRAMRRATVPTQHLQKTIDGKYEFVAPTGSEPSVTLLLGMHVDTEMIHTDDIRANALMQLYNTDVQGVARREDDQYNTQQNFARLDGWKEFLHKFLKPVRMVFLDYYFLVALYFRHDGYGNQWLSSTLPYYFSHGGYVAILPNDAWGMVTNMIKRTPPVGFKHHFMNLNETFEYHPLWKATALAEDDEAWDASLQQDKHKTNLTAYGNNLKHRQPFILFYTTDPQIGFNNHTDAFSYMDAQRRYLGNVRVATSPMAS